MTKRTFASDGSEIIIGETDVITIETGGLRVSTGAMALSREGLGDWVVFDLMEYRLDEKEVREYCSVNVSREHALAFAEAILRELNK